MLPIIPPTTVVTANDATTQLQNQGLSALGLPVPLLSPVWAAATPAAADFNNTTLRLRLPNLRAPFRGMRTFEAQPTFWSDWSGLPVAGPVAVYSFHPEAARRFQLLADSRLGSPGRWTTPVAMVVHGITMPNPVPVAEWYLPGETMGLGANTSITFHDARGLPIDPVATAHLFLAVWNFQPALQFTPPDSSTLASAGGLTGIVAVKPSGIQCHVVDPHGWAYAPVRELARLKVLDTANAEQSPIPDSGLVALQANQQIGRSTADENADTLRPQRWGDATNGTLARTPWAPPAVPNGVTLAYQFHRIMAVDLDWHLLGNRTNGVLANVPGDDNTTPDFLLPAVRDALPNFRYLANGMDVLAEAGAMATNWPAAGNTGTFAVAVSPTINAALPVPTQLAPNNRWPAFPPSATNQPFPAGLNLATAVTAQLRNPADTPTAAQDVLVTVAADAVPAGTHLRVYTRQFQEIRSIQADNPSFVRGDGGSGIAAAGVPTVVLLVNPFGLLPNAPVPNPATVTVDVVAVSRTGQRRILSAMPLPVGTTTATFNPSNFGGQAVLQLPNIKGILDGLQMRSVSPVPLFGLPRTVSPSPATPGSVVDLVRRLASEGQPRQGPRLPTQTRFETILALGQGTNNNQALNWSAVLTGGRWDTESLCARPDQANPGNPAGPDVDTAGIRTDGRLAYDLALHAVKRAQPILPLGDGTAGWVAATGGANWQVPAADTAGTVAAVMLETVAAICDSPELSVDVIPVPQPTDTIQGAINNIASQLGVPAPTITVTEGPRLLLEVQREIVTAKFGQRDLLWSWRRAFGQARELIYIEGPAFSVTARPGNTPVSHELELLGVIRDQMNRNPRLKLMVCLPRWPDFDTSYAPWVRAALAQRKQAIESFLLPDNPSNALRNRVVAFHPAGFPGRTTAIRSTVAVVDDVWCSVGTSHCRRRGLTFDGGVDVASIDRAIVGGYSGSIARFRQSLLADKLGVDAPTAPATTNPLWIRLARPEAAFDAVADVLRQGGLGRCSPIWAGPTDTAVIAQTDAVSDPDGANGANFITLFASLLTETSSP